MPTCKTCAHWTDKPPYGTRYDLHVRQCTSEKLREGYDPDAPDVLSYSYNEGGAFYTGPAFGCVHHLEKNNGNA